MSGDECFNDSDEVFNFYSSKKVTETFKAQFQKLITNKSCVTNQRTNNDNVYNTIITSNGENKNKSCPLAEEVDGESSTPVEVIYHDDLDDSVEVIEHHLPVGGGTRQSERLKAKKRQACSILSETGDCYSDYRCLNSRLLDKTRRNTTKKNRKKRKDLIDEVILLDSPPRGEVSEDEINPEISVKVIWKSVDIKKFYVRKFQKLSKIFKELSKDEDIPEDRIMLTFNNVRVNPNDTPDSLNLQIFHFLDGGVLSEITDSQKFSTSEICNYNNEDCVTLKFQDINKKIVKITINKNEKIKIAMVKYSETIEIPLQKIKFFFDGEQLNSSETPLSLGLENDEVIDIKICL